jgi:methionine-rich copper-binding protein CopC
MHNGRLIKLCARHIHIPDACDSSAITEIAPRALDNANQRVAIIAGVALPRVVTMIIGRIRLRSAAAALGLVALLCSASGMAQAHAQLVLATPPAGAILDVAPSQIELVLSESIDRHFSGLELSDNDSRKIATSPVDATNPRALVVSLKVKLPPGQYRVSWHAVAVDDGHRTQGSYTFKVR